MVTIIKGDLYERKLVLQETSLKGNQYERETTINGNLNERKTISKETSIKGN